MAGAYCSRCTVPGRSPGRAAKGIAVSRPSGAIMTVFVSTGEERGQRLPDQSPQSLGGRAGPPGGNRAQPQTGRVVDWLCQPEVHLPHPPALGQEVFDVALGPVPGFFPLTCGSCSTHVNCPDQSPPAPRDVVGPTPKRTNLAESQPGSAAGPLPCHRPSARPAAANRNRCKGGAR